MPPVQLANGLHLEFLDQTHRYYGDYHRVRLLVRCPIPLTVACFAAAVDPEAALRDAEQLLGERLCFEKTLERMGVSGDEVSRVRSELLQNFLETARTYLGRPDFPSQFVRRALAERQSPAFLRSRPRC